MQDSSNSGGEGRCAGAGAAALVAQRGAPRFMLVSDLDHTMVQNEDPTHARLLAFNRLWNSQFAPDSLLVFSTGRSPKLFAELWDEAPLLTPDVLICSVGTELFYKTPIDNTTSGGSGSGNNSNSSKGGAAEMGAGAGAAGTAGQGTKAAAGEGTKAAAGEGTETAAAVEERDQQQWVYLPDPNWEGLLDEGWDRGAVVGVAARRPELTLQPASEQRRHKVSYHLKSTGDQKQDAALLEGLRGDLAAAGLKTKVIYSGGVDVDILAEGAGKGKALEFLLGRLEQLGAWPKDGVQVNGDSGNDAELFSVPRVHGCVVANAHPELLQFYHDHASQHARHAAAAEGTGAHAAASGGHAGAHASTDGAHASVSDSSGHAQPHAPHAASPSVASGGAAAGSHAHAHGAAGAAGGGSHMFLATEPCAGGIAQALRHFGHVQRAEALLLLAASSGRDSGAAVAAAARRAVVDLAAMQAAARSNGSSVTAALPASVAPAPGAVWVTADGRRVSLAETRAADDAAAAAAAAAPADAQSQGSPVAWIDAVQIRPAPAGGGVLAEYQLWSFGPKGRRSGGAALACTALLAASAGAAAEGPLQLVHLQESGPVATELTATHAIKALSASG